MIFRKINYRFFDSFLKLFDFSRKLTSIGGFSFNEENRLLEALGLKRLSSNSFKAKIYAFGKSNYVFDRFFSNLS